MRQHLYQVFPRFGLGRIELRLNILQRDEPLAFAGDNELCRRERQVILDAFYLEHDELAYAWHRRLDRFREAKTEFPEVAKGRHMFRPEKAARRIILQAYRVIGMQGEQRHGNMLDQRTQAAQLHLLVVAPFPHASQDVGKCLTERLKSRTFLAEFETLRVVRVARRIEKTSDLTIGPADKAPKFRR